MNKLSCVWRTLSYINSS